MKEVSTELIDGSNKYFCIVRKSYVPATPEEDVRQRFLKFLIEEKEVPISKIRVEESLAHYGKGNRRVDILVMDERDRPFIIYECKKPFEPITDEVLDQIIGYSDSLESVEYLGLVIGDDYRFVGKDDKGNVFELVKHPKYQTLMNGEDVLTFMSQGLEYQRNGWRKPVSKAIIDELITHGVIGEGTDKKFHSFLVNLDGWLHDQSDELVLSPNIKDVGIKYTKFGNAGGGFFAREYRSFLIKSKKDRPIVCIALTSSVSGKNSPVRTVLYTGIETTKEKNASLQLQIGKSVAIAKSKVTITHNGTITVGKHGAAKKQDLLDFVEHKNPSLINNGVVYLGEFNENEEINSENVGPFIKRLINYALLRNDFRRKRKRELANS